MAEETMIRYSKNGLWIEKTGDTYRFGLSEKGQDDIGEVMFAELPDVMEALKADETVIGVEGAKAVTELTAPVSGKVVRVHKEVEDQPELLNSPDKDDNWIMELTDVSEEEFSNLPEEMDPISTDED
ncbi:glycine cleavage system protein H [Atopococcus tabaci]|uniref:glycine cleavage system protein H n=1 Tax=Atopococcus tabaci TaxID=269774 RepID=UPI0003F73326|nr:glycine cleavage system protein H [Atopococcus tabaci]